MEKSQNIIALIIKIQIKHKHNNKPALKVHTSLNLRYYRSLRSKGKDPKIPFQLRKQVVREVLKAYQARSGDENKSLK